ncbi:hypothetical protein OAO18_00585 [Francisellaceae bacterium]|nr:hypothetical protein [Francisellaceae bacterium]
MLSINKIMFKSLVSLTVVVSVLSTAYIGLTCNNIHDSELTSQSPQHSAIVLPIGRI